MPINTGDAPFFWRASRVTGGCQTVWILTMDGLKAIFVRLRLTVRSILSLKFSREFWTYSVCKWRFGRSKPQNSLENFLLCLPLLSGNSLVSEDFERPKGIVSYSFSRVLQRDNLLINNFIWNKQNGLLPKSGDQRQESGILRLSQPSFCHFDLAKGQEKVRVFTD